jgi:hypothetical protein
MKKIIIIFTVLLISFTTYATNPEAKIVSTNGRYSGGTVVDVQLNNFTDAIGAVTLKIGFDPNVVAYSGIFSSNTGFISSGYVKAT